MKYRFETERTIIRPYKSTDAKELHRVFNTKGIYETTYAIPKINPMDRVIRWIEFVQEEMRLGTSYEFAIIDDLSREYIGNCGIINVNNSVFSGSITYFIDPHRWNMGYATEVTQAMLKFGFEELRLERISGTCMTKNPASRRVMQKSGFSLEGTAKKELYKDGEFIDVDHLAILKEEYDQKKSTTCQHS